MVWQVIERSQRVNRRFHNVFAWTAKILAIAVVFIAFGQLFFYGSFRSAIAVLFFGLVFIRIGFIPYNVVMLSVQSINRRRVNKTLRKMFEGFGPHPDVLEFDTRIRRERESKFIESYLRTDGKVIHRMTRFFQFLVVLAGLITMFWGIQDGSPGATEGIYLLLACLIPLTIVRYQELIARAEALTQFRKMKREPLPALPLDWSIFYRAEQTGEWDEWRSHVSKHTHPDHTKHPFL